jgi:hypothetical protein
LLVALATVGSGATLVSAQSTTTTTVPAALEPTVEVLRTCNQVTLLSSRLTNSRGKPSKETFGKKKDVTELRAVATVLASRSDTGSIVTALRKASEGKPRRKAVADALAWCRSVGAYSPTKLNVPLNAPGGRIQVADVELVIAGTTNPDAKVTVSGMGIQSASGTADATGAFAIPLPGLALDKDFTVTVQAQAAERPSTFLTVLAKRVLSEEAKQALAAQAEADFKASAQRPPYNDLIRYAPGTLGSPVTYRVQVFQFDFNTGSDAFLGYVTPGRFGWSDLMYFKLPNAAAGSGLTKDSIVTVWGTVGLPYSYSTRLGTNSVPRVDIKYLE